MLLSKSSFFLDFISVKVRLKRLRRIGLLDFVLTNSMKRWGHLSCNHLTSGPVHVLTYIIMLFFGSIVKIIYTFQPTLINADAKHRFAEKNKMHLLNLQENNSYSCTLYIYEDSLECAGAD